MTIIKMKIYKFRVSLGQASQDVLERHGYTKDEIADEMRFGAKERIMDLIGELADDEIDLPLFKEEDINENEIGG